MSHRALVRSLSVFLHSYLCDPEGPSASSLTSPSLLPVCSLPQPRSLRAHKEYDKNVDRQTCEQAEYTATHQRLNVITYLCAIVFRHRAVESRYNTKILRLKNVMSFLRLFFRVSFILYGEKAPHPCGTTGFLSPIDCNLFSVQYFGSSIVLLVPLQHWGRNSIETVAFLRT